MITEFFPNTKLLCLKYSITKGTAVLKEPMALSHVAQDFLEWKQTVDELLLKSFIIHLLSFIHLFCQYIYNLSHTLMKMMLILHHRS